MPLLRQQLSTSPPPIVVGVMVVLTSVSLLTAAVIAVDAVVGHTSG